jgi:hypothetical protein
MPQVNPYTRFVKPKKPESLPMRIWGYVAAAIVYLAYGVFWIAWQWLTRDRFGRRKRRLRFLDE